MLKSPRHWKKSVCMRLGFVPAPEKHTGMQCGFCGAILPRLQRITVRQWRTYAKTVRQRNKRRSGRGKPPLPERYLFYRHVKKEKPRHLTFRWRIIPLTISDGFDTESSCLVCLSVRQCPYDTEHTTSPVRLILRILPLWQSQKK